MGGRGYDNGDEGRPRRRTESEENMMKAYGEHARKVEGQQREESSSSEGPQASGGQGYSAGKFLKLVGLLTVVAAAVAKLMLDSGNKHGAAKIEKQLNDLKGPDFGGRGHNERIDTHTHGSRGDAHKDKGTKPGRGRS